MTMVIKNRRSWNTVRSDDSVKRCYRYKDQAGACSKLMRLIHVYYRGADKSVARPGKKKARKHVRDARDFNNIEKWATTAGDW